MQLKPSQGAPKKRRFFQLSTDYTQLRWAWDKSIYMFHVQDIVKHEEQLQVELRMLDRTLFLGFLVRGAHGGGVLVHGAWTACGKGGGSAPFLMESGRWVSSTQGVAYLPRCRGFAPALLLASYRWVVFWDAEG